MSNLNDNIVGGEQSLAVAFALGNIDDPLLSPHLRLQTTITMAKPESEQKKPKLNCPRPDCKEVYHTKEELEKHQLKKCHWRCVECEMNFPDDDTLYKHNSRAHRQPQELTCPGCGTECKTAGQLMGHVEGNHCPRVFPSTLHEHRRKQMEFSQALRKMNPANEEFQLVGDMKGLGMSDAEPNHPNTGDAYHPPHTRPDARVPNYMLSTTHFPELGKNPNGSRDSHIDEAVLKKFENQWVKGETLFQEAEAGPITRPIPRQAGDITAAAPSTRDIDYNQKVTNPNDPRFNAAVFFHPILEKFVCAHAPKCKSKFQTAKGLIGHLNSQAHQNAIIFKCPCCFRDYKTMASAMAHAENATRICNIRETEDFRKFVDHVSGGMLDGLNGKDECLKDGSPRFIIPKAFYETLPFPAHIRYKQTEEVAKLGRGRMAEWDGDEDNDWVDHNGAYEVKKSSTGRGW